MVRLISKLASVTLVFMLALGAFRGAPQAEATGVPTDGTWTCFGFSDDQVFAAFSWPLCDDERIDYGSPPWTFDLPYGGQLTVTDIDQYSDYFEVFDFGVSLGLTSTPEEIGGCTSDPDVCVLDPESSHRTYDLAPGSHSITIFAYSPRWQGGTGAFKITAEPPPVPAACAGMTFDRTIYGTEGNDSINGTGLRELIYGFGGNDTINGGAGNDCLVGGEGNDTLSGGAGNDKLIGENGSDRLTGDSGVDQAIGGTGSDTCNAESESSCES